MDRVIEALERTPVEQRSLGWQNQLQHARRRATNIGTSLTTRPSERPFPDGADLYRPSQADST
ncbi:hypothetical protein, partial [Proteus mirabilis]|uniref:hypothetical protein n=1 Tax=Proteus mirabilis TaxID=584 RepID=UPI001953F684